MARKITQTAYPEQPKISNLAELGQFIRSMRTQQQLRIDDAAALCGVSVQLLSDLENGKPRDIGFDKAVSIAEQLGLAILVVQRRDLPHVLAKLKGNKS